MAEFPNQNPERNMSFKLTVTNIVRMQNPLIALCDFEFNPQGEGMVEVTDKGFEITVRNFETHAAANLFLNSSGLIDFHCNNPIVSKMINLRQTAAFLLDAMDFHLLNPSVDDTVTVFHLDGSNNLTLIYGSPADELEVELLQSDPEYERFPDNVEFSGEAVLKSELLKAMIYQIYVRGFNLVSVGISDKLVSIFIGLEDYSFCEIEEDEEDLIKEEVEHHAWFELYHEEAMKKASTVAPRFHLRFVTEPPDHIMTRFNMQELGYFVFLHRATLIVRNPDYILLGQHIPDDARLASISNAIRV